MQAIYQWLMAGGEPEILRREFLAERAHSAIDAEYFGEILGTCIRDHEALDALLAPGLDRNASAVDPVEHAILLIGAAELRDRPELAVAVIINEAVELAKRFGAENGHRFVNAALDDLAGRLRAADLSHRGDGRG